MPTHNIKNQGELQELVQKSGTVVIDCYANWCSPCGAIAPYASKKSDQTGVPMLKIEVDELPDLSKAFEIKAMPTFIVVKNKWNNVINKVMGASQQNVDYVFQTAQSQK